MTLKQLYEIIENRKKTMPKSSYVASLFAAGKDRIIQKVGEETTEVVIAAKNEGKDRLISEVADLIFHLLILLSRYDISLQDIEKEFTKRRLSMLKQKK